MKLNTLEEITNEDDVLVLVKEDQKDNQIVEKESQCRDEEKRSSAKTSEKEVGR